MYQIAILGNIWYFFQLSSIPDHCLPLTDSPDGSQSRYIEVLEVRFACQPAIPIGHCKYDGFARAFASTSSQEGFFVWSHEKASWLAAGQRWHSDGLRVRQVISEITLPSR